MPNLLGIAVVSAVVAIDNALLAGLLLPHTSHAEKRRVLTIVGILLGLSQVVLAAGVDVMLRLVVLRLLAIVILTWMSVRTLTLFQPKRGSPVTPGEIVRTWFYTVAGNLDNMIWLGSELKGERWALVFASIGAIPLFVAVSYFLAEQCEKQQWILPLGAGMMAWAAAALALDIPFIHNVLNNMDDAPHATFQCLITVLVLAIGFGVRHLIVRRRHFREL